MRPLLRRAIHNRTVPFSYLSLDEQLVELALELARFRENDQAAHFGVQALRYEKWHPKCLA